MSSLLAREAGTEGWLTLWEAACLPHSRYFRQTRRSDDTGETPEHAFDFLPGRFPSALLCREARLAAAQAAGLLRAAPLCRGPGALPRQLPAGGLGQPPLHSDLSRHEVTAWLL